ncbi:MAG: 16S rRNA (cytidine(1402)-2'-O)-methyltransferase [Gammaproteobacteria bacterium]|nr:16S rRNA (cytidine(1402)-2'-O)-methyltransferase [Gammaproteobacteria bacterium]
MIGKSGKLYVVATPIGNLEDITARALRVLSEVALIAAEDTRHTGKMLLHFGISTTMTSFHDHNERDRIPRILQRLQQGEDVALVSDAGTPLISDPGYELIRRAHRERIEVVPVPGASALLAALCASGLPIHGFVFEGFLPSRPAARRRRLEGLRAELRTIALFESAHRIVASLADMCDILDGEREAVLARELTKVFETVRLDTLFNLYHWVDADPTRQKGEFVIIVQGAQPADVAVDKMRRVLRPLLRQLPLKQAVATAAELTGARRNALYALAVELKQQH